MLNPAKNSQGTPLADVSWLGGTARPDAPIGKKKKREYDLSPIPLQKLMFSAKIDYSRIEAPGHCELPPFHGLRQWGVAAHFKELTLHDATPEDIGKLMEVFGKRARILALEVAVDARPRGQMSAEDRTKLLERVMIDLFARCLEPSRGKGMLNRFRAYYRKGEDGPKPFEKRLPRSTDQLLYGHREEAVQTKCYFKKVDQGIDLPEAQHVARVEVRLDAPVLHDLSLYALEDLGSFDFRKALMPYFAHVQGVALMAAKRKRSKTADAFRKYHEVNRAKKAQILSEFWDKDGVGALLQGGRASRWRDQVRFVQFTEVNNRIGQALMRLERQHAKESVRAS